MSAVGPRPPAMATPDKPPPCAVQSPSKMERHIELFGAIEKALVAAGQMVVPCVYVAAEVDKAERDKLKETVRAHGGTIAGQRGRRLGARHTHRLTAEGW